MNRVSIGRTLFCLLLLLQVTIVILLLSGYHIVDPALYNRVKSTGSADTLDVAAQLGRFDLISMFLGIIAVLIGIMAVSGFWMIRGAAIKAAEDAAKVEARIQAEITARIYLEENTPALVSGVLKSRGEPMAPNIGLTEEQIQEVTSGATEIGENQNGDG
jgi:hypothetical protein